MPSLFKTPGSGITQVRATRRRVEASTERNGADKESNRTRSQRSPQHNMLHRRDRCAYNARGRIVREQKRVPRAARLTDDNDDDPRKPAA